MIARLSFFLRLSFLVALLPANGLAGTFRIIAVDCGLDEVYYEPSPGSTPVPLAIRKSPSKAYPNPKENQLAIFRLVPPPPDAPKGTPPTKEIVASAPLSNAESSLAVLTQGADGAYSLFAVPDDIKIHPAGVLRVVNLCRRPIGMRLNKQSASLEARTSKLFPLPSNQKAYDLRFAIGSRENRSEFWEQSMLFYPEVRGYAFICDLPEIPEPLVKIRFERPPGFWAKPTAAP